MSYECDDDNHDIGCQCPGFPSKVRDDPALIRAIISSYSILSLLHHRGLIDSENNRSVVKEALDKLHPFSQKAERIAREQHIDLT